MASPKWPDGALEFAGGGSRSMSSAAMMNKKLKASIQNADAVPNAATMMPAGAGTSSIASCCVAWESAFAAGSCCGVTSDGSKVCAAGAAKASAMPKRKLST